MNQRSLSMGDFLAIVAVTVASILVILAASFAYAQPKVVPDDSLDVIEHVMRLCQKPCVVISKEQDDATIRHVKELERKLKEQCS